MKRFFQHSWVRHCSALAILTASLGVASWAQAQSKLAVVDTQRAVMETEDGLRAAANLKKLFESRQRELDQRQNDLAKERDDIEKQKGVLSKEALQKRVEKWQAEMVEIQSVFVEYNKELQKKQAEITQPILNKALNIIRRLATQGGYDMVLEKQVVPYHRSDLDLTDQVITMYNSGAEGSTAPASAPAKTPAVTPAAAPAPKK
jgi:outer membrane protein